MSGAASPVAAPPAAPPPLARTEQGVTWVAYARQHRGWILVELVLLLLALGLDVLVARHPAPLPGDVGSTLALQQALLPHKTLTLLINQTSELTWPLAATLTTIAVVGLLLLLLFLTYRLRYRARRPRWWVWPLRVALLAVIVLMGPSRMLEGEHWLSDVVAGYLYGAFWLILGLHVYDWAAQRWPRLLVRDERRTEARAA